MITPITHIVLVEFGYEDREADAFKTLAGAKEYFIEELDYVTEEQFDMALRLGSYENCNDGVFLRVYPTYILGD